MSPELRRMRESHAEFPITYLRLQTARDVKQYRSLFTVLLKKLSRQVTRHAAYLHWCESHMQPIWDGTDFSGHGSAQDDRCGMAYSWGDTSLGSLLASMSRGGSMNDQVPKPSGDNPAKSSGSHQGTRLRPADRPGRMEKSTPGYVGESQRIRQYSAYA